MRTIQSGDGMTPSAPWTRSIRGSLAVGRVVEPLVEGGLLHRRLGLELTQSLEELDAPGVDIAHGVPGLRLRPLDVDDGPAIADELAAQLCGHGRREELCGLDLTPEGKGLLLRAHARLVVAREREEDDEAGQHGKARRQYAEHPGSTVAVGEVAAFRSTAANEQHRGYCGRRDGGHDERCPDEVHGSVGPVAGGGSLMEARRFVSGVSGTSMRPRVGRSRSNVTSRRPLTSAAASTTVTTPRPTSER